MIVIASVISPSSILFKASSRVTFLTLKFSVSSGFDSPVVSCLASQSASLGRPSLDGTPCRTNSCLFVVGVAVGGGDLDEFIEILSPDEEAGRAIVSLTLPPPPPLEKPGGGLLRWEQLGRHMYETLARVENGQGRRRADELRALDPAAPRPPPPPHSESRDALELVDMR